MNDKEELIKLRRQLLGCNEAVHQQWAKISALEKQLSKAHSDAGWAADNRRLDAEAERLRNGGW